MGLRVKTLLDVRQLSLAYRSSTEFACGNQLSIYNGKTMYITDRTADILKSSLEIIDLFVPGANEVEAMFRRSVIK